MEKKILPLRESPYDTFNSQRNLHSILLTYGEDEAAWVYTAFIQLSSEKELQPNGLLLNYTIDSSHTTSMYDRCLLLESFNICDEILSIAGKDISELYIDFINNDFYIMLTIDKYWIKKYRVDEKSTHFHDIFIYGYDLEDKQFLAIDYFGNKPHGNWISFEELKNGYESGKSSIEFLNGIFITRKRNKYRWKFNINHYKENIEAYINCQSTVLYNYRYEEEHEYKYKEYYEYGYNEQSTNYFGLDCYKTVHLVLDEVENRGISFDIKIFHLLMKHKFLLLNSIEYITRNKHITDMDKAIYNKFNEIYIESKLLFNWALKYNLSLKQFIIETIRKILYRLESKERQVLKELLSKLSHENVDNGQ